MGGRVSVPGGDRLRGGVGGGGVGGGGVGGVGGEQPEQADPVAGAQQRRRCGVGDAGDGAYRVSGGAGLQQRLAAQHGHLGVGRVGGAQDPQAGAGSAGVQGGPAGGDAHRRVDWHGGQAAGQQQQLGPLAG